MNGTTSISILSLEKLQTEANSSHA